MLLILAALAAMADPNLGVDPRASVPLAVVSAEHAPGSCHVRIAANGMQLPDPKCTPGAVNPTVTGDVLRNPAFRTSMVRDDLTSEAVKRKTYAWYGITPPADNATGPGQLCELDHLISLDLGGSDGIENIWPQCQAAGAPPVPVGDREFKVKDAHAELGLMRDVKAGADLTKIQHQIADDWTQFIEAAH